MQVLTLDFLPTFKIQKSVLTFDSKNNESRCLWQGYFVEMPTTPRRCTLATAKDYRNHQRKTLGSWKFHRTRCVFFSSTTLPPWRKTGGQADAAATAGVRPFDRNYCSGLAEISYARTAERRGAESPFRYANSAFFRSGRVRVTSQADPTYYYKRVADTFDTFRSSSWKLVDPYEKRGTSRCPAFSCFFFSYTSPHAPFFFLLLFTRSFSVSRVSRVHRWCIRSFPARVLSARRLTVYFCIRRTWCARCYAFKNFPYSCTGEIFVFSRFYYFSSANW